jgi:molybdate transport system permease protein
MDALRITGITTSITLAVTILAGTPLAYFLARREFFGKGLVELAADLPMVLPPVVAGVALLMVFGRRGMLGAQLAMVYPRIVSTDLDVLCCKIAGCSGTRWATHRKIEGIV